jgi:hypothetical protein
MVFTDDLLSYINQSHFCGTIGLPKPRIFTQIECDVILNDYDLSSFIIKAVMLRCFEVV